eukprot:3245742-Pleurochrysis_carterae.AAC.1
MTGLAKTSESWASCLAANDLPHERLALLEAARRQFGVTFVVCNFDCVRCGEHILVLVCHYQKN